MSKPETPMKKIKLRLVGLDGNAFSLMGAFSHQAKREGWQQHEINAVLREAQRGNYEHLLATLAKHCEGDGMDLYNDEEDE